MTGQLTEIKARRAKITPGEWNIPYGGTGIWSGEFQIASCSGTHAPDHFRENAAFLAHAPEDIDFLLAQVERMRQALEKVKDLSVLCLVAGFQHGKTPGFDLPEIQAAKTLREEMLAALEEE